MRPSPYQLAAFTEAARARSFSRAAREMGVTQSSITQHVQKLERLMGAALFIRRRDGLELTRAGGELFALTDRLRSFEQVVEEKIASYTAMDAGHLSIIANAPRPAMPIIARYGELFPRVEIDFTLDNWTDAMRKLALREADIGLVTEPEPRANLYIREIGTTRYLAHLRRDHPLAGARTLSLETLTRQTLILPEDGSLTQRVVEAKLAEHRLTPSRIIQTTTFPLVKEATLHGVGVGIFLEDSLFPSSNLVGIPIREMPERYRNCLVTQQDRRDLRAVRCFVDLVFEGAAGAPPTPVAD